MNVDNLQVLVRKTPLKDKDWEMLIEGRLDEIRPHLDSISLRRIGDIIIAGKGKTPEEQSAHSIRSDHPQVVGHEFSLETQGFFTYSTTWIAQNTMVGFGLTRKRDLVLFEIALEPTGESSHLIVSDRPYRARRVKIQKASPKEILEAAARIDAPPVDYEHILSAIGGWVKNWRDRVYLQAERANDLVSSFENEDELIKIALERVRTKKEE